MNQKFSRRFIFHGGQIWLGALTLFLISCGGGGGDPAPPAGNGTPPATKTASTISFADIPANNQITRSINGDPFTFAATGSTGTGAISYTSSEPTVATVDSATGEVTIVGVGQTIITATRAEDDNFQSATASYTLTVNNKVDPTLSFASVSDNAVTVFNGSDPITHTVSVQAPDNTTIPGGTITYTSSNPEVATVDSATGELTIVGVGATTITATRAADDRYNEATASYTLTVQMLTPPVIPATQSATAIHTLPLTEAIVIENTGAPLADDGCRFVDAADSSTTTTDTAGLSIAASGNDCHIIGTPQRSSQATAGTPQVVMLFIRAFNAAGSDWTTLTLTINPIPPDLGNLDDSIELTLDTPIATITFANASDGIVASNGCDISPALPAGLAIEPTTNNQTCRITGTPTHTLAATTYTVTASDGITPDPTPARLTLAVRLPAMQIQTGESHSCLLNPTGEIWCWGYNGSGQLGTGDRLSRERPNRVGGETDWRSLTVGENHNCAINSSGELYCWGIGNSGRLGTGNSDSQNTPTRVGSQEMGTLTGWQSVNADAQHTCGIREDGANRTLYCWGARGARLGIVTSADQTTPAQVGSETDWQSVSAGTSHTCGIRDDGSNRELHCWGTGGAGRLGRGDEVEQTTPAQVMPHMDWKSVSVGTDHTCGIRDDGTANTLFCWGAGGSGRLGTDDEDEQTAPEQVGSDTDWQNIIAGREHTCGIRGNDTNRTLYCWGAGGSGRLGFLDDTDELPDKQTTPKKVGTQTDWRSVSLGRAHTCGIRGDGVDQTLWCWGSGVSGRLGTGDTDNQNSPARVGANTNWNSVSVGASHTCGIRANQTLWCWGSGANGRLGTGNTTNQNIPTQVDKDGDANWQSVSAGEEHTCGIRVDGANQTLWCWGEFDYGRLGIGISSTNDRTEPTRVGDKTDWRSVSAGLEHTCGIRHEMQVDNSVDQTLQCWGLGTLGQLGIITVVGGSHIPIRVGTSNDWHSVTAGEDYTCGIRVNGANRTLWCWGAGGSGRLGLEDTENQFTPDQVDDEGDTDWQSVNAGGEHTCGIRGDGTNRTLWCWGAGGSGRLGRGNTSDASTPVQVGSQQMGTLTGWQSVSAGNTHTCGIRGNGADQTLWCWGNENSGRLGVGNLITTRSPRPVAGFTTASLVDSGGSHTCALETTNSNNSLFCWGDISSGRVGIGDVSDFADTPRQTRFAIESLVTPTMLAEALDTTEIAFNLLGTRSWMAQTEQTNDNTDAAAATTVSENDLACITSTVSAAGSLSFYWRVSSEMDSDFLNFYLNTIEIQSISGMVDWVQVDVSDIFPNSELRWCYEKDGNTMTANEDGAFLDQVVFTPTTPPATP